MHNSAGRERRRYAFACITPGDLRGRRRRLLSEGGAVVLVDCLSALEEGDGRSSWTPEPNAQLRLGKAGFFCLSQRNMHGSSPGAADIAAAFGASAKCDSSAGSGHEPAMALDRDVATFWASGSFPDAEEHLVVFELDLGKSARLAGLQVDWEYPALSYKLQVSPDGKDYNDVLETHANPSNVTYDMLPGPAAQHLRIVMTHPHSVYGKVGEEYLYGIREIFALASRIDTSVADCKEAANTDDARDKYFLLPIHEYDSELASKIESLDADVASRARTLSRKTKEITSSMTRANTCVVEKEDSSQRINTLSTASLSLKEELLGLTGAKHAGETPKLGYLPGDSVEMPAEDCFEAKQSDPEAASGFYWILPRCAPQPLRVFCDMTTSTSMYFWRNDGDASAASSTVHSVGALRLRCAEKGLEPLVLSSLDQLRALRMALEQIGIKGAENAVVPLAHDMGCLESKFACAACCRPHVDIGCDDVAAQHPAFFGVTNDCPIESLSSVATSFLDLQALGGVEAKAAKTPHEKAEDVLIDPMIAALINEVLLAMDQVHGLDPSSVYAAQSGAADAVSALLEVLEPAESLQKKTFRDTGELLLQAEGGASALLNVSGSVSNQLDDLILQLEKVKRRRQSQIGFESFALSYSRAVFTDIFQVFDSRRTAAGPSSWGFAEVPVEGRQVTIGQSSAVRGKGPTDGTFAFLKAHRFFDGVIHVDFIVSSLLLSLLLLTHQRLPLSLLQAFDRGAVGVAFRMRDPLNTFLLSFDATGNSIKLFRVEEGEAFVVAQSEGPAYQEAKWNRVRIELHHGHVKAAVKADKQPWKPTLQAFDEAFLSGTVGLFVSGVKRGAFFDGLRVEAAACSPISSLTSHSNNEQLVRFSSFSSKRRRTAARRMHTQVSPASLLSAATEGQEEPTQAIQRGGSDRMQLCFSAVHPLERQAECRLIAPRDDPAELTRCTDNFCGRCCRSNTSLLGTIQKHKCLQRCKEKEVHAAELQIHFSSMLDECTDLDGEGFSHCMRSDKQRDGR
ncbi:hypothetical protein Efla_002993 [Eimeria flavescens]